MAEPYTKSDITLSFLCPIEPGIFIGFGYLSLCNRTILYFENTGADLVLCLSLLHLPVCHPGHPCLSCANQRCFGREQRRCAPGKRSNPKIIFLSNLEKPRTLVWLIYMLFGNVARRYQSDVPGGGGRSFSLGSSFKSLFVILYFMFPK